MMTKQAVAEATYQRHLSSLQGWVGWFALVRDDRLGGVFPSYAAAAKAWMSMYGPVPALIRRIERTPKAVAVPADRPTDSAGRITSAVERDEPPQMTVALGWAFPAGRPSARSEYAA